MADELMDTYKQWSTTKDPAQTTQLLRLLDPTITSALRSFAPGMEDAFKLKAQTLAFNALPKYDMNRGMHLKSFVYQSLQPMQRLVGQRTNPVKVPERKLLDGMHLTGIEKEFVDKHDREPTVSELADLSGMSIKRITSVRSLNNTASETSQVNEETGDSFRGYKSDPQEVWSHYIYHGLDPIDQKIFEHATGFGGASILKKSDIAVKLKMSPPAVSQRINKIAAKLQEGINLG